MRPALFRFVLAGGLVLVMLTLTRAAAPPTGAAPRVDAVGDPLPDAAVARFGTARFRDPNYNSAVALSPDGKLLAVSSSGEIRLHDTASGKEVRRIVSQGQFFAHGTLVFSPNGKLLVFSDHSGTVICDAIKGEVISHIQDRTRIGQGSVSLSGDGNVLALGGQGFRDKLSVRIWDVAGRKERKKIEGEHEREVRAALSADGKTVAVWGQSLGRQDEPQLKLLDTDTGKQKLVLKGESYTFQEVVFSPDGKHFATIEPNAPLAIREVATGKVLRQFAVNANTSVLVYSPDGTRLATGAANGTVQIWDPLLGRRLGQCKAPAQTRVTSLAFTQGNAVLAAGVCHQMIRLWDVPSGRERTPAFGHQAPVSAVAFSHDGKTLLSAGADGVRVHSLATRKEVRLLEPPPDRFGNQVRGFNRSTSFLSGNGRYLVWAEQHGRGMTVVDLHSDEEIAGVTSYFSPLGASVAFTPDGTGMASVGMDAAGRNRQVTAQVWDLEAGLLKQKIKIVSTSHAWALALSPGGKLLATAPSEQFQRGGAERVALWDVATGKETTHLAVNSASKIVFSPDGSMLATSGNDGVSLWDAGTGQLVLSLAGGGNGFQQPIAFSPDGRLLAVASRAAGRGATGEIHLAELASGKTRATFTGHRDGTLSLAFSADGRLLASGGADTTVMLWDTTGVTTLGRLRQSKLTGDEITALWADLDNADAGKAHKAMARLVAWPAEAMKLLGKELKPAGGKPPDEKTVERYITDLGDDSFEVREKASRELRKAGRAVRSAMLKALAGTSDLEKKRRLEQLLRALRPGPSAEMIRLTRALEVLERIATPEARRLLEKLAAGNASARLTGEAADVLKRLERGR